MKNRMGLFLMMTLFVGIPIDAGEITRLSTRKQCELTKADIESLQNASSEKHPVEGYASNQAVVDCFDEMAYRYTGGRYQDKEIRFRLRMPDKMQPGKKYPLVVWFHGLGESDNDNKRQLAHFQTTFEFLAGPKKMDFFILATQCPGDNRSWTNSISQDDNKGDASMTVLREIFDAVVREYPVDENKISAFGLSAGGNAAWQFVSESPEQFAAIAACSATPPEIGLSPNVKLWLFACTKDEGVRIDFIRNVMKQNLGKGSIGRLTEIDSSLHDSWTEALKNQKVLAWMVQQDRTSNLCPPPGSIVDRQPWSWVFVHYALPGLCIFAIVIVGHRPRKETTKR